MYYNDSFKKSKIENERAFRNESGNRLLIDEPQHVDYFDPFAIMLTELFTEYQDYGRFPNWIYNMDDVKEVVIDEETKDLLLQVLNDIYNENKVEGRERNICIQWQKTEMTEIWKRHLESLISSLRKSIPYKETEEEIIERKKKEEKENKSGKGIILFFVLMFGIILAMGAYILFNSILLLKTGKILQGTAALLFSVITLFFSGKLFLGFFKGLFK